MRTKLRTVMTDIRAKRRINMGDVARALNITPSYLCNIERLRTDVPLDFPKNIHAILYLTDDEKELLAEAMAEAIPKDILKRRTIKSEQKDILRLVHQLFLSITIDEYSETIMKQLEARLDYISEKYKTN